MLAHSPSQTANQQRLETYLATSDGPTFCSSDPFDSPKTDTEKIKGSDSNGNDIGTPRALASRLKILELYTLHILPQNNEWHYAREFIRMNAFLDEERREDFLQALDVLGYEGRPENEHEQDLIQNRDQQLEAENQRAVTQSSTEPNSEETAIDHQPYQCKSNTERDPAIDESNNSTPVTSGRKKPAQPVTGAQSRGSRSAPVTSPKRSANDGIYKRGAAFLNGLQLLVYNVSQSFSQNPLALLRFILFLVVFILALSRRDVKDRIKRITGKSWDKIRQTIGMGVKVSYI